MSDDLKAINGRLKELSKEFQDLSALKKKLLAQNTVDTFKDKYGDYKYLVKTKENKEVDFIKMVAENNLKITSSVYGMLCASYEVDGRQVVYHIAKTEEECEQVRVVQSLFSIGDEIQAKVKEGKKLTAKEILDAYDTARSGQQLEQSEESEEVSE